MFARLLQTWLFCTFAAAHDATQLRFNDSDLDSANLQRSCRTSFVQDVGGDQDPGWEELQACRNRAGTISSSKTSPVAASVVRLDGTADSGTSLSSPSIPERRASGALASANPAAFYG